MHNAHVAATIPPVPIFDMDRYKNRDQEIAPTDIGYRDFVLSCGSGLLTAIIGIIEDHDQEIAPTKSRSQRSAPLVTHVAGEKARETPRPQNANT